jgi:NADH-quinone oxidoreductase subunit F
VIGEVSRSGLRGRGGAGFPTGDKWRAIRGSGSGDRYVVCNAAEGEPGTYKDRFLLRQNPYQVLEGLAIAARAVGARASYLVLKETFPKEIDRVVRAAREMADAGILRDRPMSMALGPDLYLLGEETGLLEAVEGNLPLPRPARPFVQGLFATPTAYNPTAVNNAETLANVPWILAEGAEWLRVMGTESSPGTMLFTIAGDVLAEGVFELPLGTPLRYLIEEIGGGTPNGRRVKAVFPGAANTVIPPEVIDVPMDFESMRRIGSGLGAGSFVVFDETACMVQAAQLYSRFLWIESCGQCPACKLGSAVITECLERLETGGAAPKDIARMLVRTRKVTDGQRCGLPTGESLLVQSLYFSFPAEFQAHLRTGCQMPRRLQFPKIVDYDERRGRFVYDTRYGLKNADWTYRAPTPTEPSPEAPAEPRRDSSPSTTKAVGEASWTNTA